MKRIIKNNLLFIFGLIFILFFFHKVFVGLLPIPTDNIVGIYHPYRDYYSSQYPRGVPFQNMQVSDPVRQQYLWRELAISVFKQNELPLWNPYNFTGYPLLANFQSAVFYPINLVMFLMPFQYGWTLLIMSQIFLAFIFMFSYLISLKTSRTAAFIGSIAFSFSGFFVSWLEWGNIVSTGLWLPLILLSIDRVLSSKTKRIFDLKNIWGLILLLSLVSAFFAGHLQTFFYLYMVSVAYFLFRWFENGRGIRQIVKFALINFTFILFTSIQWIPTLQLIGLSAREVDQVSKNAVGWFIPWQNSVQFIVPDFFGNPATLNYWGVWNYGEFIGYMGILPIILALVALFFIRSKLVLFYALILITGILFAYSSVIAKIPFVLDIPFISNAQPTRLLYLVNISIAILAALGFDYFIKKRSRIIIPLFIVGGMISSVWFYVLFNNLFPEFIRVSAENIAVSFSNLRFPTLIYSVLLVVLLIYSFVFKGIKKDKYSRLLIVIVMLIFLFDIFRFASKYTVFSDQKYLYPTTKSIEYIKNQDGQFRVMETDSRVLPPNFTISYEIQSIDGYDPLYLMRYGEFAAAISRNEPNINPPFGFNRIITPQNFRDQTINILNIKYVLSLSNINDEGYTKVFEENETKVYKKENSTDRAFFVNRTIGAENKYDAINKFFEYKDSLDSSAVVEGKNYLEFNREWFVGKASIISYKTNEIIIDVENKDEGFMVLTDSFYPTWSVSIDGVDSEILRTNYNFRGVVVPGGSSQVVFTNHLL